MLTFPASSFAFSRCKAACQSQCFVTFTCSGVCVCLSCIYKVHFLLDTLYFRIVSHATAAALTWLAGKWSMVISFKRIAQRTHALLLFSLPLNGSQSENVWERDTQSEIMNSNGGIEKEGGASKIFLRPLYFIFGASVLALLFPYSLLYLFSYHFAFHLKFMEFIRDLKGESDLCSSTARTISPLIHVWVCMWMQQCTLFAFGHHAAHKRPADKDAQNDFLRCAKIFLSC